MTLGALKLRWCHLNRRRGKGTDTWQMSVWVCVEQQKKCCQAPLQYLSSLQVMLIRQTVTVWAVTLPIWRQGCSKWAVQVRQRCSMTYQGHPENLLQRRELHLGGPRVTSLELKICFGGRAEWQLCEMQQWDLACCLNA